MTGADVEKLCRDARRRARGDRRELELADLHETLEAVTVSMSADA